VFIETFCVHLSVSSIGDLVDLCGSPDGREKTDVVFSVPTARHGRRTETKTEAENLAISIRKRLLREKTLGQAVPRMHRVGTFLPLLSISKEVNERNTTRQ
jgi:hypothetical protein